MSNDFPYRFENPEHNPNVRTRETAAEVVRVFAKRLGVPDEVKLDTPLLEYVVDVHLNIEWYVKRLAREQMWRRIFIVASILLLPTIPLLIWRLGYIDAGAGAGSTSSTGSTSSGNTTAVQITAMITGILAIHKAIAAWLDKRQLFSLFWRASAELKEILYSLEQTWQGQAHIDGELRPEFLEAVNAGIKQARQIIHDERQNFYELYRYPSFDVFHKLNEAFSQARTLTTDFTTPAMKRRVEQEQKVEDAERRLRESDSHIAGLEEMVAEAKQSLTDAADEERMRLEHSLTAMQQNLDQARYERIRIQAELDSFK